MTRARSLLLTALVIGLLLPASLGPQPSEAQAPGTPGPTPATVRQRDTPATQVSIVDLGSIRDNSIATGINDAGQVVGYSYSSSFCGCEFVPFFWSQDTGMRALATLGTNTQALA